MKTSRVRWSSDGQRSITVTGMYDTLHGLDDPGASSDHFPRRRCFFTHSRFSPRIAASRSSHSRSVASSTGLSNVKQCACTVS